MDLFVDCLLIVCGLFVDCEIDLVKGCVRSLMREAALVFGMMAVCPEVRFHIPSTTEKHAFSLPLEGSEGRRRLVSGHQSSYAEAEEMKVAAYWMCRPSS